MSVKGFVGAVVAISPPDSGFITLRDVASP